MLSLISNVSILLTFCVENIFISDMDLVSFHFIQGRLAVECKFQIHNVFFLAQIVLKVRHH